MKICRDCKQEKELNDFDATGYINKAGNKTYKPVCKMCRAIRMRDKYHSNASFRDKVLRDSAATRAKHPERIAEYKRQHYIVNKEEIIENNKQYQIENKDAIAVRLKQRRKEDPEKFKLWARNDYNKNKQAYIDRAALWSGNNRAKCNTSVAKWTKNNPGKNAANRAKRRSAKLDATPIWSENKEIQAVYDEAAELTKNTGVYHEVDHVIPLQNSKVSGLHGIANLEILTRAENRSKSNKF